ncbi:MAG: HpcH/HpaI aldolase/citrate lyase family protein [Oscillospiraceae bacterium]|nr:HpcH/HpaI aldolase/citrate lyase family protein [Oscillospiraceae bacterium]
MFLFNENELLPYKVGALMYAPALKAGVGENICGNAFPGPDSLAFCLEDTVNENGVKAAEAQLVKTLTYISENKPEKLPLLFVRVRNCSQFRRLPSILGDLTDLLTGVIFPKFDLSNAAPYCSATGRINSGRKTPLYIMPILESGSVLNLETRKRTLLGIRELLDGCKDYVLNIRVGAMDFCKAHGLRRPIDRSIYDIGVARDALTDILTVFADSFVVSAPVWEYFQGADDDKSWECGMENELKNDIANGFIGKTVIHPSQIPVVRRWLKPSGTDVEDAKAILDWKDADLGVAKSAGGNRMNELATHGKWARKIIILSEIYGIKDFL